MRKLTIIKVLPINGGVNSEDLERWREIFRKNEMTIAQAEATGEVAIEYVSTDIEKSIMLVRLGGPDYQPSTQDLEAFRDIFEQASKDPDFKIFTHRDVSIDVIKIDDIVAVE
jgi:hypothetical protein